MTIEEYLAELRRHLRVGPLAKRRIVREIESHLSDASLHARVEAENKAIEQLGTPEDVAGRFPRRAVAARWVAIAAALLVTGGAATALVLVLGSGIRPGSHVKAAPLVDCTHGCRTLLGPSTSPAAKRCFENYLASPTRRPISEIGKPTGISVRKGSLVLAYRVRSRRRGLEVVAPCPSLQAVIATERGTTFRFADSAVTVERTGGISTITRGKSGTGVTSASIDFSG